MKKIIAIITVGAAAALMQVNAQETKTTEKETYPEAQEEVIDERAQPSADYQHNQYGTYPQGIDSTVVPQTRVEITKNQLPEKVLNSFESSEYNDQEIVAIYEVTDEEGSEYQQLSDEQPISDPTYHNDLNERSRIESGNSAESEMEPVSPNQQPEESVLTQPETETTLEGNEENPEEGNVIDPRPSDTELNTTYSDSQTSEVKYEIEVKDEEQQTTLTYSEEGELEKEEVSEESSM
jgi:hypothetical protein